MSLPFHPLINTWFTETYGKPTPVQEEAWPLIARGGHVLALAPTGSGKTLTGFLAAISRFTEGVYNAERLSVLYVSPLKALNEDIRRNLLEPLEGIRAKFEKAGENFPSIRVETRSGDTPQSERRRFLSRPPSILALTPESLGILLLNPRGRAILSSVRYVILDEIHTALGSKRGCYLSCQIDRLALVAGEFQRVALSATVKTPEAAADFAGGLEKSGASYVKRKVHIVSPEAKKEIRFQVLFPDGEVGEDDKTVTDYSGVNRYGKRYTALINFIIERIRAKNESGTVLVFTGSRRRAERINYVLNQAAALEADFAGRPLSYCHHGSLSKDVRRAVEKALTAGEIPCVIATGSLELGIDIGSVSEVILAGSPGSAATTLQRVGRSGHAVGMTSHGSLIPFHCMDLLQAAAISGAVEQKELEETACIENPLDILSQLILAFTTEKEWNEDELYETLRGFYIYRNLSRASYDSVVRMLAGAYEDTRLRELKRHIYRDEKTKMLSAAAGALLLLYTSGGVIVSRGYYSLRLAQNGKDTGAKIGELDEEFVFERRLGDCFDFGNRSWRITAITNEAVEVMPLGTGADYAPFWKGETVFRSPVLSRRILEMLDGYNRKNKKLASSTEGRSSAPEDLYRFFSSEAKETLENFLAGQCSSQGTVPLPGPAFIPTEIFDDPDGRGDAYLVILYSFRGGAINTPLSLALQRDIEIRSDTRIEGTADDNTVLIRLPRSAGADPASTIRDSLRRLCEGTNGEARFHERLESSGIFGAAFREAAERSLLLPRSPYGKRMPLWMTRQKSKRLFDAVSSYRDFPVAAEAWRSCLRENFDMEGFRSLLEEIRTGETGVDFFTTRCPSPFFREMTWNEVNSLMYVYDERPDLSGPPSKNIAGPSLSDQVIAEALGDKRVRPDLKADLTADFCSRLRRELPGWAPDDALTLCEWVKERIAIPEDEWEKLLECIPPELKEALNEDRSLGGKLVYVKREGATSTVVVHREWEKKWKEAGPVELATDCLAQWLRYEGPLPLHRIAAVFGLSLVEAGEAVHSLSEQAELVEDVTVLGSAVPSILYTGTGLVCDRENLELLLRLGRRKQRPEVKERPAPVLVPFLARRQGLMAGKEPWKNLSGLCCAAKLWETEFFPCRSPSYSGEMFDREIREGRLLWYGSGKEKAAFSECGEIELVLPWVGSGEQFFSGRLSPDFFDSPRSFWDIKDALDASGSGMDAATEALWEEVWKGRLSADSWEPVRRALELGFAGKSPEEPAEIRYGQRSRIPRAIRERWRAGPPVKGNWFSLMGDKLLPEDILEEEELKADRVRLLLKRWGLLARPLLEREEPLLSWSRLLPAIRRMELSGELVAGRFFSGINSLQFASPRIAEELEEAESSRGIYWMNAADPASPAGLAVEGVMASQVRRIASSRLCFRGSSLLAISNRGGRELEIFIPPDDPDLIEALTFIKFPRTRKIQPETKIVVEKINGKSAAGGAYSEILVSLGFVKDRGKMILY